MKVFMEGDFSLFGLLDTAECLIYDPNFLKLDLAVNKG